MKGRRGSSVGKRHSLMGRAEQQQTQCFGLLRSGTAGPWTSRGGSLICQTKVVNACLAHEVLGRLKSSTSERQRLQRAPGKGNPGDLGGGGSTLGHSRSPAPHIWAHGIYPEGQKPQGLLEPEGAGHHHCSSQGGQGKIGRWLWQSRSGSGARRRCPGRPAWGRAGTGLASRDSLSR